VPIFLYDWNYVQIYVVRNWALDHRKVFRQVFFSGPVSKSSEDIAFIRDRSFALVGNMKIMVTSDNVFTWTTEESMQYLR